jgi:hypothetical protein
MISQNATPVPRYVVWQADGVAAEPKTYPLTLAQAEAVARTFRGLHPELKFATSLDGVVPEIGEFS